MVLFVKQISVKMSTLAQSQVKAEKDRLIEAKNIAESEKRLYVKVCIETYKFIRCLAVLLVRSRSIIGFIFQVNRGLLLV